MTIETAVDDLRSTATEMGHVLDKAVARNDIEENIRWYEKCANQRDLGIVGAARRDKYGVLFTAARTLRTGYEIMTSDAEFIIPMETAWPSEQDSSLTKKRINFFLDHLKSHEKWLERASEIARSSVRVGRPGGSLLEGLICWLAQAYEYHTHRPPGRSHFGGRRELDGPFVRFVEKVFEDPRLAGRSRNVPALIDAALRGYDDFGAVECRRLLDAHDKAAKNADSG
jgi:hypothetical protein